MALFTVLYNNDIKVQYLYNTFRTQDFEQSLNQIQPQGGGQRGQFTPWLSKKRLIG